MNLGGNKYDTQFTSLWKKRKYFMHEMKKLGVDVTFTQMTANKGINKHVERAVADIYKEYTQLEYIKEMGALDLGSLTRQQKKSSTAGNKPNKRKN